MISVRTKYEICLLYLKIKKVFVPGVVGAKVVVCLRSCLVGLAVAGGILGFRIVNLSDCFKLFTLSNAKQTTNKNTLQKELRSLINTQKTELGSMFLNSPGVLTCFARFAHHVWFLVEQDG